MHGCGMQGTVNRPQSVLRRPEHAVAVHQTACVTSEGASRLEFTLRPLTCLLTVGCPPGGRVSPSVAGLMLAPSAGYLMYTAAWQHTRCQHSRTLSHSHCCSNRGMSDQPTTCSPTHTPCHSPLQRITHSLTQTHPNTSNTTLLVLTNFVGKVQAAGRHARLRLHGPAQAMTREEDAPGQKAVLDSAAVQAAA